MESLAIVYTLDEFTNALNNYFTAKETTRISTEVTCGFSGEKYNEETFLRVHYAIQKEGFKVDVELSESEDIMDLLKDIIKDYEVLDYTYTVDKAGNISEVRVPVKRKGMERKLTPKTGSGN